MTNELDARDDDDAAAEARSEALATEDPEVLIQIAADYLAALVLQHDALRVGSIQALRDATSCPCPRCNEEAGEILGNLSLVERDQQRLEFAIGHLNEIRLYPTPKVDDISKAIRVTAHCDAVNTLERTLRSDGEDSQC